jgi:hypothetical protein
MNFFHDRTRARISLREEESYYEQTVNEKCATSPLQRLIISQCITFDTWYMYGAIYCGLVELI